MICTTLLLLFALGTRSVTLGFMGGMGGPPMGMGGPPMGMGGPPMGMGGPPMGMGGPPMGMGGPPMGMGGPSMGMGGPPMGMGGPSMGMGGPPMGMGGSPMGMGGPPMGPLVAPLQREPSQREQIFKYLIILVGTLTLDSGHCCAVNYCVQYTVKNSYRIKKMLSQFIRYLLQYGVPP
ncbi:hypothetical protein Y032_0012g1865 [Ancylostoma ceylanicum]|uniref:Uncharacterized protein n=1 Tax=Ancylostoma ceylanicum TaxID=53326 RepID=A0A016VEC9_9BILA|nr:hypothetical protein Y032_0012g1865 [Ancylostoma ceylanicum]